jgi:hypothetical protein
MTKSGRVCYALSMAVMTGSGHHGHMFDLKEEKRNRAYPVEPSNPTWCIYQRQYFGKMAAAWDRELIWRLRSCLRQISPFLRFLP